MKIKMILPALTEAKSPFFRPIKYSLFPPLGLATLAGYLGDEEVETVAAEAPDADGLGKALTSERAAEVNAAVAKLPERYRVPLALAYYGDQDYDEIAAALGITRNHVGVLLCRAKQLLRQSLTDEGMDARVLQDAVAEGNS